MLFSLSVICKYARTLHRDCANDLTGTHGKKRARVWGVWAEEKKGVGTKKTKVYGGYS